MSKKNIYKKYILKKYSFPSNLDINNLEDIKKFICHSTEENYNNFEYTSLNDKSGNFGTHSDKTSIFFSSLLLNNKGFINFLLNECEISLETTEFIQNYRNAMYCQYCAQFYCLSENFPADEKITPLMYAVLKENYNATYQLIRRGANVNFQTKRYRMTPLLLACRLENSSIVKLLVKFGADVTHCDVVNKTCIMHFLNSATCLYRSRIYNKNDCCHLIWEKSKMGLYSSKFIKILKIIQLKINDEMKMKELINQPEIIRNYTPYHIAMKVNNHDITDAILKYGGSRTINNLIVYNDNKLKTVLNFFDLMEFDNTRLEIYPEDVDDNNKKLGFLHYCLTSLRFLDYHFFFYYDDNDDKNSHLPHFKICNNEYYSSQTISNACIIIYFEHLKHYDIYNLVKSLGIWIYLSI